MKKILISTFIIVIIFTSNAIARCYDDFDWSWGKGYNGKVDIEVKNTSKNKIIIKELQLKTSNGDLMKKYSINRTLAPYGTFEQDFYPKLNNDYLKAASLLCDYHSSVKEKIAAFEAQII